MDRRLAVFFIALVGASLLTGCTARMQAKAYLKKNMLNSLNDPDSVKFRDLKLFKQGHPEQVEASAHGRYALCGEVQSKNAFGVYTGWSMFYSVTELKSETEPGQVVDGSGTGLIPDMVPHSRLSEAKEMAAKYAMYCQDSEKIEQPLP